MFQGETRPGLIRPKPTLLRRRSPAQPWGAQGFRPLESGTWSRDQARNLLLRHYKRSGKKSLCQLVKRRPGKLITLRQKARVIQKSRCMLCDRCEHPLIEIDHYGERLKGCLQCNCWKGDKSAFIVELSVEDFEALRDLITRKRALP